MRRRSRRDPNTVLVVNPGADLYGSDRMAVETVRALVAGGRRVIVAVPADGPLVPLLEAAGAQVVMCPTPIVRKGLLSLRGLLGLFAATITAIGPNLGVLRRSAATTVVVNTLTPPLWLPLSRLTGHTTICHVHEGEASVSGLLRRALYLPLLFSNRIIINSRFSLGVLRSAAPWLVKRTIVIYNAVAAPTSVVPPRSELHGTARLLFVGRLSHRKGPHVALEALRLLLDRGHDVSLALLGAVFPGNEEYAEYLEHLVASSGLKSHTQFLGFRPSVWEDLSRSDIVLIPSTVDEPFGNTAVEAALAARPSVISAVGGLPEACEHSTSSILVPPGDASALADAVQTIVADWSGYTARAVSDSKSVAAAFSPVRYGDEMLDAMRPARFPHA